MKNNNTPHKKNKIRVFLFWSTTSIAIFLALFVLVARIFMDNISNWQEDIVDLLEENTNLEIQFEKIEGQMLRLYPVLKIHKLNVGKNGQHFLNVNYAELRIDLFKSLINFKIIFDKLDVVNMAIWLEQTKYGWGLLGMPYIEKADNKASTKGSFSINKSITYLKWIFLQNSLKINNLEVYSKAINAKPILFFKSDFEYENFFGGKQLYSKVLNKQNKKLGYMLITKYNSFIGKTPGYEFILEVPAVKISELAKKFSVLEDFSSYALDNLQIFGNVVNESVDFEVRAKNLRASPMEKINLTGDNLAISGNFLNKKIIFDYKLDKFNIIDSKTNTIELENFGGKFSYADSKYDIKLTPINLEVFADKWHHELIDGIYQLKDLRPKGQLSALEIKFSNLSDLKIKILADKLDIHAWDHAPELKNLTAWIIATPNFGRVIFKQNNLEMGFNYLFNKNFILDKAQGIVDWEIYTQKYNQIAKNSVSVSGKNILLEKEHSKIYGNFNLLIPETDDALFDLNLGLKNIPYNFLDTFLPEKILDPELNNWIKTATKKGLISDATLWIGDSHVDKKYNLVDLSFAIKDGELAFLPEWPSISNVKGLLRINNGLVTADINSGTILGANLEKGSVKTYTKRNKLWIDVKGKLQSKASIMQRLFNNTPLTQFIPNAIKKWRAGGILRADLDLKFPIEQQTNQKPYIGFFARLINTKLNLVKPDLIFENINGTLEFDSNKGFFSKGLTAYIWDSPIAAKSDKWDFFNIDAKLIPTKAFQWLGVNTKNFVSGSSQVNGYLNLANNKLVLNSNLEGVGINLPQPFYKPANSINTFNFGLDLDSSILSIKYIDKLNLAIDLSAVPLVGIVNIADKNVDKNSLPPKGFFITLTTDNIILDDWLNWWKQLNYKIPKQNFASNHHKNPNELDIQLKIDTKNLVYKNKNYRDFLAIARNMPVIEVAFVNPYVKGDLTLTKNIFVNRMGSINFKYIKLPENLEFAKFNENLPDDDNIIKPAINDQNTKWILAGYPPLDLNIDSLEVGNAKYGLIKSSLEPYATGLLFNHIIYNSGETSAKGYIDWKHLPYDSTRLKLDIEGGDLSKALKRALSSASPIITAEHSGNLSIAWKGAPYQLDLENISGNLDFKFINGQFPKLDIGGLRGLTRIFSLFNIDTILRRLSLDFSDLTAQGLSFTDIRGSTIIADGIISTISPIMVKTTATSFTLEGEIDLIKNFINQELVIIVPVSQTLPIIALLAGSTQIGLAIWATQKLFGNFFDNLTKARYKIYGDLSNPELKLMQVF